MTKAEQLEIQKYQEHDRLIEKYRGKIRKVFNELSVMPFDKLNVVETKKYTKKMYDSLIKSAEEMYLELAKSAYADGAMIATLYGFDKAKRNINKNFVDNVLNSYNLVTGYLFFSEAERKRLRLNEEILTAREFNNRTAFRDSVRKSARYWNTQSSQYGIETIDEATEIAFKDAGIRKVMWITMGDDKVCKVCRERNGHIYDIDKVPPKPHYNCRCLIRPIGDKK